MEQLDQFIGYLFTIEENNAPLTQDQFDKLKAIQGKVSEIVSKMQTPSHAQQPATVKQHIHQAQPQLQMQLAEKKVQRFAEYTEINEKIQKRDGKFVVLNKKGTKVLGTHKTRKEAVKQLQAIEISKAQHASNKLKTFVQFITESRGSNWNYAGHYASYLKTFADDESILQQLKDLDTIMNHLEDTWWYNREGQTGHYALNMKIHQWPDLEKWAEAKGETEEEDIDDERMYNDWARFMEETYEISAEDYENSYDWIKEVGVGGRSGGWLLLYLNQDHEGVEWDLESHVDTYLNSLDQLEDPNILADLKRIKEEESDTQEMIELGLISEIDFEAAESALSDRENLETFLHETIADFNRIERDLEEIQANIDEFKKTAAENFYDWIRDSY